MSMSGDEAYVLAMDYVDETLEGGGALKGDDGKSAYQSWLDLGNTGTEEDFINSLKGEKGQVGEKGETGNDGKSSYEIWLDNGNVGTEQDFLDSLKGEGTDGFSPVITENSNNTDEDYRLDIETKERKFTTPNLKADISRNIAEHNTSPNSHNDIRIFLNELNNRLNALANSDDETLDEMKEVVAYIKDNRSLIESITTTKLNVADIIDNLTTNVSNKPLSASQGVVIKNLIDTLQSELTAHINNFDIHVTPNDKTNWNNATDKINNLEVGGTNLIAGTKDFTSGFGANTTIDEKYKDFTVKYRNVGDLWEFNTPKLESDTEYTLSFYAKGRGAFITYLYPRACKSGYSNFGKTTTSQDGNIVSEFVSEDWVKYTFTWKTVSNIDNTIKRGVIPIRLAGDNSEGYLCGVKFEKGNVATDWTPALEDKIEIADVNGLQTIADNSQCATAKLSNAGWYRIAKYEGDSESARGSDANSCDIRIRRGQYSTENEHCHLLLKSNYSAKQQFKIISSSTENQTFSKIRYVYNSTTAYIDVYYNTPLMNTVIFELSHGKTYIKSWQTITPTIVEETVEGETVSTVFDIPANANPVTNLDLTIDAIQGLRAELDELRSLITNS